MTEDDFVGLFLRAAGKIYADEDPHTDEEIQEVREAYRQYRGCKKDYADKKDRAVDPTNLVYLAARAQVLSEYFNERSLGLLEKVPAELLPTDDEYYNLPRPKGRSFLKR